MSSDDVEPHRIVCRLDALLEERGMTLTELARRTGITIVNLSVLKNNRGRAIRFTTMTAICDALDARPGDLFDLVDPTEPADQRSAARPSSDDRSSTVGGGSGLAWAGSAPSGS